ncbi:hypothetical protein LTR62_008599 [Meristemomyces frigidus]|uniref:Uncharacterized protein n=1 Tax=Meristemomyces frigidus TaxID=1508187 RepID=A0AAN7T9U7_9PEZI|nr:hypothetical protein LTR62_008599 [Meristemomyces frigidus]
MPRTNSRKSRSPVWSPTVKPPPPAHLSFYDPDILYQADRILCQANNAKYDLKKLGTSTFKRQAQRNKAGEVMSENWMDKTGCKFSEIMLDRAMYGRWQHVLVVFAAEAKACERRKAVREADGKGEVREQVLAASNVRRTRTMLRRERMEREARALTSRSAESSATLSDDETIVADDASSFRTVTPGSPPKQVRGGRAGVSTRSYNGVDLGGRDSDVDAHLNIEPEASQWQRSSIRPADNQPTTTLLISGP